MKPRDVDPARAGTFAARVVRWQREHGRHDLPWQRTDDPYRIWLSEIMLQQTQVATVIPYFDRFVASFPTVTALAAAPLDDVLLHWSGLGYYRRAHHLHAAARRVVDEHDGAFPGDVATLATLPGIGRSTAGAIAVFAHGAREAILDGNVKRVLARHRGIEGFPGAASVEAVLWKTAKLLLPQAAIESYTQGLMDLGATLCMRTRPRCEACPVAGDCVARGDGRIDQLPSRRPSKALPQRAVRVLLLERMGEWLLEKRPATGIWGGLWSLPEAPIDAEIVGLCAARFNAKVVVHRELPPVEHGFTHFRLTLHPTHFVVRHWPAGVEAPGQLWLSPADAIDAALPAPIRKILRGTGD